MTIMHIDNFPKFLDNVMLNSMNLENPIKIKNNIQTIK